MTAPVAATAIAEINTQIAVVSARIASIAQQLKQVDSARPASSSFASALSAASSSTATPSSGSVTGADVVNQAESYLGTPYVWGAESRTGIDCSGLVHASYSALGIQLPRVAADQAHAGTAVASLADARPGDLLFFGDPAYHVAIYLGNDQLIESPEPGKTVHITDVYQTPTSIRRVLPDAPVARSGLTAAQLTDAGINPAVAAFAGQFAAAESSYHLPAGLLAAVAQQESGGNVTAVSPAGAEGLMQLMPRTAASLGVNPDDPAQAITAAARILADGLSRFGSVPLALAAYNAGAGAVSQYGGIPPYAETQNYVRSITSMLAAGG